MNVADNRGAWADFWSAGAKSGGCLPGGFAGIEQAQRAVWEQFARGLRKKARILDLGSGDGAVLRMLAGVRRDLALTGVDSAPTLPQPPAGARLRAGVPIERLPFADASFDAVTSQFGYEYGETALAAREAARVVRPGGRICMVIHRRDGPIVAHNLPRRDALAWALAPDGWLDKARALLAARAAAPLPTPPAFRTAAAEAERLFPGQSAGGEFLQAVVQTLDLGRFRPASESADVLRELESRARNEIARITALERAACSESRIAFLADELGDAGFRIETSDTLAERGSDRPFAWILSGER